MSSNHAFSRISSNNDVRTRESFDSFSSSTDTLGGDQTHSHAEGKSLLNQDSNRDESISHGDAVASTRESSGGETSKTAPVTWMSLPKKGQLAVLTIARLSEPLSERSLAAYLFYQLKWFDSSLPDSTIASQGGILTAAFAAAQFLTAVWWGRAADTPWIGRKNVLLIGLTGTAIASIGVGFSKTFYQALFFRALAGCLNGNIGVMRTMLSEIIQEKKFQSRAFLLLPMCFNIGVVIGPILGGFLADPIQSFPHAFGPGCAVGGKDGVKWMVTFPYALPNLFSGIFILISALSVVFGLDETHEALRHKRDIGRSMGKSIVRLLSGRRHDTTGYSEVASEDTELQTPTRSASASGDTVFPRSVPNAQVQTKLANTGDNVKDALPPTKSPFRRILQKNVILTLASHHLLAFHVSAFNALIFLLLPAPRSANAGYHFPSLRFAGGIGLSQEKVGLAVAILGIIGLPLQLVVYPPVNSRLGTLKGYRTFLPFSFIAYIALPFLVLLPEKPVWVVWVLLSLVLASQVLSRTFALTGTVILVNNSSPHPSTLGTVHGVAQSASSAARMLGPTVGGYLLGLGLKGNLVGGVWWGMALVALGNWLLLFLIYEGDGAGGRA